MLQDSITDCHLEQLDVSRIRRVTIDGVKFASNASSTMAGRRRLALCVGDGCLQRFSSANNFPVLVLDRCSVTTETVCNYTQQWFNHMPEAEMGIRTQVIHVYIILF